MAGNPLASHLHVREYLLLEIVDLHWSKKALQLLVVIKQVAKD
jgi:hypothetical protein